MTNLFSSKGSPPSSLTQCSWPSNPVTETKSRTAFGLAAANALSRGHRNTPNMLASQRGLACVDFTTLTFRAAGYLISNTNREASFCGITTSWASATAKVGYWDCTTAAQHLLYSGTCRRQGDYYCIISARLQQQQSAGYNSQALSLQPCILSHR